MRNRQTAILFRLIVSCLCTHSLSVAAQDQEGDTKAPVIAVTVGLHDYAIPADYVNLVRRDKNGGVIHVGMKMLWPDLKPMTAENAHLWKRSPKKTLKPEIYLTIFLRANPGHRAQWLGSKNPPYQIKEPGPFGLIKYSYEHPDLMGEAFVPAKLDFLTPVDKKLSIACTKITKSLRASFPKALPVCETNYPYYQNGEGIYYRYYKVNLRHWRAIDRAIHRKIMSFQR